MTQCRKCGTANRAKAKFCEECGAPLAFSCPVCGIAVSFGSKFCGECGTALATQAVRQSSPLVPQSQSSASSFPLSIPTSQSPLSYTPAHLANRILSGKAAMEGERKIVTVLFADIKGSMEIMENLDPEEAQQLLDPCLQCMIDAVHKAEGTVNRLLGDGLMALFGAPLALEDHAQRALHAALRTHAAVRRYAAALLEAHSISLQIRIGINTGEVVVRTIGNDLYMDYSAVGHVVGLAARMEALAPPGSTLVTAYTHHLAHNDFHFAARGSVKVKGVSKQIEVYELLGQHASRSRLAARAARGLAPFVGRARELAQLREIVTLARHGRGQVVALVGEAGVGKSRLLEELKPLLRTDGYLLIEGAAFAYGKTQAYLPLIDMLKRYCEITDQDAPALYQEKLRHKLAVVDSTLADYVPVFLELIGGESGDAHVVALSAEAKLHKILDGIKRLIALHSRHQPVALLIEDLQWLDARSVTFLHALITGIVTLPIVFLFSCRPEHTYPWEDFSFSHCLHLAPLPQEARESLFTALVGNDPNTVTLAPLVCEQSGGNPFFLEEIVQHLIETGTFIGQPAAYTVAQPVTKWTLPATVHGVLASRLDRLELPLKALLQAAAVIGREFSRPLLARVANLSEPELDQTLTVLQSREFLHEIAVYPDTIYTFKHALTQEVAYQSLLREHRAELHSAVGAAIEVVYADRLPEYVNLLAYHYSRSASIEKALRYLHQAAQHAFDLYADTDALYFWEEHLQVLSTLPPSQERDRREVRTRLHLINVLSRQNSDDGPIRTQFAAAKTACHRLDDPLLLAELHATLAVAYVLWGRAQPGLTHASMAKRLADSLNDIHTQIITRGPLAHLLWIAGRFTEGSQVAEEGLALLQRHRLLDEQLDFVAYPYVQCLAIAGACQGFLGDFDQGLRTLREAAASAAKHGNRIPQALSYWGLALLHSLRGEASPALQAADQALALMQEVASTTGVLLTGSVREYLAAVIAPSPLPSSPLPPTPWLTQTWHEKRAFCELAGTWLAEGALRAGRWEEALQFARAALTQAETTESSWFLSAAHAVLGKILGQAEVKEYASAESHLLIALKYAETMQCHPLRGRVMLEIGEMLQRKHREVRSSPSAKEVTATRERAREYLTRAAEVCEKLEMRVDLQRTRTLLAQLDAMSAGGRGSRFP